MGHISDKPFATIESAQDFMSLLSESIIEAKHDVETDIAQNSAGNSRRIDALRVASVHLHNLQHHIIRTRRILNDLRSLRRLLFEERAAAANIARMTPTVAVPAPPPAPFPVSTVRAIRTMARAAGGD